MEMTACSFFFCSEHEHERGWIYRSLQHGHKEKYKRHSEFYVVFVTLSPKKNKYSAKVLLRSGLIRLNPSQKPQQTQRPLIKLRRKQQNSTTDIIELPKEDSSNDHHLHVPVTGTKSQ